MAYLALASVCFFWGTTYLGIRVALETFPPLTLMATRFLISGTLMLVLCRARGMKMPTWREAARTAFFGVMILGVGNGCLTYSEKLISSSTAALFIAASPFWMVGLEAVVPGGERMRAPALVGIVLGFIGAALLVAPDVAARGFAGAMWQGFLLLQFGCASWSLGSILQKRRRNESHAFVTGAVQQLATGAVYLGPALAEGGHEKLLGGGVPLGGWLALAWLVTFGSIIGYNSYIYALEKLPVALVSIYTYVNPMVAAVLGWFFYREQFGRKEAAAMAVIFLGVTVVKRFTPSPAPWRPAPLRSSGAP
ncbi:MAG: EamA family transporter [Bryobacteraceae bacterium]